jgi:hypothetical protein
MRVQPAATAGCSARLDGIQARPSACTVSDAGDARTAAVRQPPGATGFAGAGGPCRLSACADAAPTQLRAHSDRHRKISGGGEQAGRIAAGNQASALSLRLAMGSSQLIAEL